MRTPVFLARRISYKTSCDDTKPWANRCVCLVCLYFVYQFLKKLVTPFEKTKAFELGIIDEKGKILKRRRDLKGDEEKSAYNLSDTLVWNLKKILGKIPFGKSKLEIKLNSSSDFLPGTIIISIQKI